MLPAQQPDPRGGAMKRFPALMVAAASIAAAAWLAPSDVAAQSARMRLQTAVPAAADEFKMLQKFAQRVDAMTGGRLKIEVLPDGAVVGAFEILDAVDKGLVESGFAWTHYWSGKSAAAML